MYKSNSQLNTYKDQSNNKLFINNLNKTSLSSNHCHNSNSRNEMLMCKVITSQMHKTQNWESTLLSTIMRTSQNLTTNNSRNNIKLKSSLWNSKCHNYNSEIGQLLVNTNFRIKDLKDITLFQLIKSNAEQTINHTLINCNMDKLYLKLLLIKPKFILLPCLDPLRNTFIIWL